MSFEWYPFDDVCSPTGPQVGTSADLMRRAIASFSADGLDPKLPLVVSEYGFSPYATAAEDDLDGAIVNVDGVGTMLSLGGAAAYFYGYEPDRVEGEMSCSKGNNMMLLMMPDRTVRRTATFYATQMMTKEWLQSGGGHRLIASTSSSAKIGVYAVRRPDGRISVMLLNRDPVRSATLSVKVDGSTAQESALDELQFSHEQYKWDAALGMPVKDDPPAVSTTNLSGPITLPPYSITVLRTK